MLLKFRRRLSNYFLIGRIESKKKRINKTKFYAYIYRICKNESNFSIDQYVNNTAEKEEEEEKESTLALYRQYFYTTRKKKQKKKVVIRSKITPFWDKIQRPVGCSILFSYI